MVAKLNPDRSLQPGSAIANDKLGRKPFAEAAIRALGGVSRSDGYVVTVEGPWGTGKSSALSMIQDLLKEEPDKPVIVNFNPWIIGNRDTLLKEFFDAIHSQLNISSKSNSTQKTAKLLKSYGKALTAVKLVPGISAIAAAIQDVVVAVADGAEAIAKEHESNLEQQRATLIAQLSSLSYRIVVFIDDVDRLIPTEVLELIRIIKAIGGLPNLGYVVAWDRDYVEKSIESAGIPNSRSYLDKIVQIRLPLPVILEGKRQALLQAAIDQLPDQAHRSYFKESGERLSGIYYHGLKQLLRHPRDIARTINWLAVIEPTLRGEILLADLIALSCIMTKAPAIYSAMHDTPMLFQGRLPSHTGITDKERRKRIFQEKADSLFNQCDHPEATQELIFFLFPAFASACGKGHYYSANSNLGLISEPGRLALALNFNVDDGDVSLSRARSFIYQPQSREEISRKLPTSSLIDFIEAIGSIASEADGSAEVDFATLCIDVASIVDNGIIVDRLATRDDSAYSDPEATAAEAIEKIVASKHSDALRSTAYADLLESKKCLTTRAEIVRRLNANKQNNSEVKITLPASISGKAAGWLAADATQAAKDRSLWLTCNPSRILWVCMRYATDRQCRRLFKAIEKSGDLDNFVQATLKHSYSSESGQSFAIPEDRDLFEKFSTITTLKRHASKRLKDPKTAFPLRSAWMAIAEEKIVVGRNGAFIAD